MSACVVCSTDKRRIEAQPGSHTCDACSTAILRTLRELEFCLLALSAVPVVTRPAFDPAPRAPGFGTSSPCRDEVIVQLDPRSEPDTDSPASPVLSGLLSWTREVSLERDVTQPARVTITGECAFLRRHHGWITQQTWVEGYANDLKRYRDIVRGLDGLAPEPPQGYCWVIGADGADCGGPLWWTDDRDGWVCGACGREYRGAELLRYQVGQAREMA